MTRIIIAIDVDNDDLREAYAEVYRTMMSIQPPIAWESTDTWFDDFGNEVSYSAIQDARMDVLSNREKYSISKEENP